MKTIGEKIQLLREEKNMNQKELADLVGITEATLSRYENNKREPRGLLLAKLAKTLNVSTDYLLDETLTTKIPYGNHNELSENEIIDIEKEAEKMISNIEGMDNITLCGNSVDDEDKEYLKQAYQKFLMDIRVYNTLKYTSNKYK